jgi:ATP-dependent DNA helicase RecG
MIDRLTPLEKVPGVTRSMANALLVLGMKTVQELLLTPPRRYEDYTKRSTLKEAKEGEAATFEVEVVSATRRPTGRRGLTVIQARVTDGTATARCDFFNQPWLLKDWKTGRRLRLAATPVKDELYGLQFRSPAWEAADGPEVISGKILSVYRLTEAITQKVYRRIVDSILREGVAWPVADEGDRICQAEGLVTIAEAVQLLHAPKELKEVEQGRRRLAFEELLVYQLALTQLREGEVRVPAPVIPFDEPFAKQFASSLPFQLTDDQRKAVWACVQDLEKALPMRRLLQGDVGSGKTAVAAFLAALCQRAGKSSAILAPTDLLAKQHAATLRRFLAPWHIPLLLLTRTEQAWSFDREERSITWKELPSIYKEGPVVVVGTHALLYGQQRLPLDLGLAVVDEQHRFGVAQREKLSKAVDADGRIPHFLSMTATPIPRSLTLMLYGDVELSFLKQKPAGRLPILTKVCVGEARAEAYRAVRQAVVRGERAYVVCPLIDPSETLQVASAEEEVKHLKEGPLAGLRVGLVHGKQKAADKEAAMKAFAAGELDVLVATSVIEVGVDVPQATVILIEAAERFGLAQLHQLRGRVGRSILQSHCFLLTDSLDEEATERLRLLEKTQDGFELADEDLKRRGSGSLLGTEQSGEGSGFKAATYQDLGFLPRIRELVAAILHDDGGLKRFPRWKERVEGLQDTTHLE